MDCSLANPIDDTLSDYRSGEVFLRSPAKVNLYLRIKGKRADGYHELISLITKINLYDEIKIRRLSERKFVLRCPQHPELENDDNLILRVCRYLVPEGYGVDVTLHKNIPIGAGLGGGSSNAACTINAMRYLFALDASESSLHNYAASLGADVPLFLWGAPSFVVTGIGTKLRPIKRLPKLWMVITNPGIHIASSWAYQNYRPPMMHSSQKILTIVGSNATQKLLRQLQPLEVIAAKFENNLEDTVVVKYPQVLSLKSDLVKNGAMAAIMSGSGSSVFGLFRGEQAARLARSAFENRQNTWSQVVHSLCSRGS